MRKLLHIGWCKREELEALTGVGRTALQRLAADFRAYVRDFMQQWQARQKVWGEVEADECGLRKVRDGCQWGGVVCNEYLVRACIVYNKHQRCISMRNQMFNPQSMWLCMQSE